MLFTLLLTALTATSGEDTHYSEGMGHLLREGVSLLPSGLAGDDGPKEEASLTWTGGHTAGKGERGIHYNRTYLSITD